MLDSALIQNIELETQEITDRMHQMQQRLHQLEDHNYMINNQERFYSLISAHAFFHLI